MQIKTFKVDKLNVVIYESRVDMECAAYEAYKQAVSYYMKKQSEVRAVFAAAHSQDEFLTLLENDEDIDFSRITAFHMDEYIGLTEEAPQKFGSFLRKAIFSKKPFKKVNYINSETDVSVECARYGALLREAPLDIVSLGIGENGHLAFNDPAEADFTDKNWLKEVHLDHISRQQQVNDGEFRCIDEVPETAYTVTIPALMSCKCAICIVPTERKSKAVYEALNGEISESCPASILRTHDNALLFLDKDAAKLIL